MRITKDAQVRKQEILEAALVLFAQKGIGKTSMSDIAKASQITKGLVYYYFASKEKLIAAVVSLLVKEINLKLQNIVQHSEMDFYDKLAAILKLYFVTIKQNRNFIEYTPANAGVFELIKNRLAESAFLHTKDFIRRAMEKRIITISYPEYTLKILINGIADLYMEGVQDPKILAVLIEQSFALPEGSIKL